MTQNDRLKVRQAGIQIALKAAASAEVVTSEGLEFRAKWERIVPIWPDVFKQLQNLQPGTVLRLEGIKRIPSGISKLAKKSGVSVEVAKQNGSLYLRLKTDTV